MMLTVASMPVAQKSSLDHLIIPYEDSPVDYGVFISDQGSQYKDEPTVSVYRNISFFFIYTTMNDAWLSYELYRLLLLLWIGHHQL